MQLDRARIAAIAVAAVVEEALVAIAAAAVVEEALVVAVVVVDARTGRHAGNADWNRSYANLLIRDLQMVSTS
jgi:hypothetical protein